MLSFNKNVILLSTDKLLTFESIIANEYRMTELGQRVRRPRIARYVNRDVAIADHIFLLQQDRITLREFLLLNANYATPLDVDVKKTCLFTTGLV